MWEQQQRSMQERMETLWMEAEDRRQCRRLGRTLWARLLPPLRRLEGWLERRARQAAPQAWSQP